ncbi:hypothetical protein WJX74_010988 [Apatococcus lobatus]|uniref:Uncharacterized protein n=1 Tax=Apatococcus lobatus TaxID=904363 RepID=A0AAW1QUE2_9CHLO
MGNVSGYLPEDLGLGYVGFEIYQAGDRRLFKPDPRQCTVRQKDGPELYAIDYSEKKCSWHILIKHMSLQEIPLANGHPYGSPTLEFFIDSGWGRDAKIVASSGMTSACMNICDVRKGSTFKFSYEGKQYRWQRRPAGNWVRGFPDHAKRKLVEMNGKAWGPTMASLYIPNRPDHGVVATLYMRAAASGNPVRQDLIILTGLVAMQQDFIQRRYGSAASGGAAVGGAC